MRDWFTAAFDAPTRAADARLAGDRARRVDADPGADRQRQDAGGVSLVPRPPDVRAGRRPSRSAAACSTSRRSRRWRSTSSATCARRWPASRRSPQARGDAFVDAGDRGPHRRHAGSRARALSARAGRHPDHHARVALPAADLERARGAALGRHRDHRRDPRAGADQARRAPRAVARTARGAAATSRCSASACRRRSGRSTKWPGFSAAPSADRRRPAGESTSAIRRTPTATNRAPRRPLNRRRSARSEIADEFAVPHGAIRYRPVTIVDAGAKKALELTIEVPVEDMARLTTADEIPSGPASVGDARPSIWSAIHPRLLELIRAHRSTLIFVNSRRLAERLAGALNELAGETLVRSHHGSIARPQRVEVEDLLKAGALRALVATSSLELGIDMGAIDLVVQIEAPPSVASGLQRIGRGGHQATRSATGVIFPKFRGDLVACAAVAKAMHDGAGRSHPLSAQSARHRRAADRGDDGDGRVGRRRAVRHDSQRGAVRRVEPHACSTACSTCCRAAIRPTSSPSCGRASPGIASPARSSAREGAKRVAIANGGTIPDRGLYGVFLVGAGPGAARVGELDEEMVFESRVGETFVLGASSWRIEEITHDRVLVSPAPGEPGKMPFWKGDRAGRPLELGLAIGRLMHDLLRLPPAAAIDRLTREHDLDRARRREPAAVPARSDGRGAAPCPTPRTDRHRARARRARRLARLRAVAARRPHPRAVGDGGGGEDPRGDRRRRRNAVGRRRVRGAVSGCGPAARSAAAAARSGRSAGAGRAAARRDGAVRRRSSARTRRARCCCRSAAPGMRAPLWQQRKRAADLLAVASRYGSFPVLLETYRECLRDFFDMPALIATLADVRSRTHSRRDGRLRDAVAVCGVAALQLRRQLSLRRRRAARRTPRPGAGRRSGAAARAARRRRAARAARRRRDGRDRAPAAAARSEVSRQERRRRPRHAAVARRSRPRRRSRARARSAPRSPQQRRRAGRRAARARRADRRRAALHRRRGRGALPRRARRAAAARHSRVAARSRCAIRSAISRCATRARTRRSPRPTSRRATGSARAGRRSGADAADRRGPAARRRVPSGRHAPRVDRRRRAAHAAAPLARQAAARSRAGRSGGARPVRRRRGRAIVKRRHGADALLDAIEQLQGAPLPASILETEILPARIDGYDPADLDAVDGGRRSGLGRRRAARRARRPRRAVSRRSSAAAAAAAAGPGRRRTGRREREPLRGLACSMRSRDARRVVLRAAARGRRRRLSRPRRSTRCGIWSGRAWSPTTRSTRCAPSRARARRGGGEGAAPRRRRRSARAAWRRRRPKDDGRWSPPSIAADRRDASPTRGQRGTRTTRWAAATTQQLLARHGVVTREAVAADGVAGGFGDRLSGAEGDGGERPHPARLLRRRPRRDAVRAARRARSAALAARRAGRSGGRRARGDRSGEPVRRHAEVAVTTINAELADAQNKTPRIQRARRWMSWTPGEARRDRSARR